MTNAMPQVLEPPSLPDEKAAQGGSLRELWWRAMDWRIGIVPVPVGLMLLGCVAAFVALGKVPTDITMMIPVLAAGGFACAEIGRRLPLLRRVGAAAILATFVPSLLVRLGVLPASLTGAITTFTDQSNFLYLFIGSIIVGSILGMDRVMLIRGFLKILAPILAGSLAAFAVGTMTGTMLGLGLRHTIFMVVFPVLAGGVGEGAIPLSIGYSAFSSHPQGDYLAEILPAVMFGSLTAIVLAGGLNLIGKRRPHLTGRGILQPGAHDMGEAGKPLPVADLQGIGGALVLAMTLYLVGELIQDVTRFPGPVTMLGLAVLIKLLRLATPMMEAAAYRNYQFFAQIVTYPLLFAIGVAKTPWDKLVSAFNLPTITTIVVTVVTLTATGFFTGRMVGLFPVEAGIITACRASQGGTGDVAILSACDRMVLMPFAQVATRIGGALTVTVALALFVWWHV